MLSSEFRKTALEQVETAAPEENVEEENSVTEMVVQAGFTVPTEREVLMAL